MKSHYLIPLLAAGLLSSCDSSGPEETPEARTGDPAAPAAASEAPSAETLAAIEAQPIGKKLLGNMVRLSGDTFQPADPSVVPEAYFVYYSASW